jgi:hypothetical protein
MDDNSVALDGVLFLIYPSRWQKVRRKRNPSVRR